MNQDFADFKGLILRKLMTRNNRASFGLIIAGLSLGIAHAELDPITVYAKRIPTSVEETTSAITILSAEELKRMQENRLIDSLNLVPGIQGLTPGGQTGNIGTVLIRGLSTKYMQVVVDGVRLTDSTNGAGSFLGNAQIGGVTNLEVLRGPQSVIYGSGAAGGVIGYDTALGQGESTSVSTEVGNFGTFRSSLLTQGSTGNLSYAVGVGLFETDNDPQEGYLQHDYRQGYEMLALEWQARDDLSVRLSYRGSQNELKVISDSGFGASPQDIDTDTHLFALNATYQVNPWWSSRVIFGYYKEDYAADFSGFLVASDYDRASLNWVNEIELHQELSVTAGLEFAHSDYRNLNIPNLDYENFGIFVNGVWTPSERFLAEVGLRYEDHNVFGGDVAWNVGAVYELAGKTNLRVRAGEAYRTPTLIDSQAFVSPFGADQVANPALEAEQVFGYEIGLAHDFNGHLAELSFFDQQLDNAIGRGPIVGGVYQNINLNGQTDVSGLEFAVSGELSDRIRYRFAGTRQFKEELIDVPDLQLNADLSYKSERFSIGVGASYLDGASYGLANTTDSYHVTRIYGTYILSENITLYGRMENLFDEDYLLSDDGFLPVTGHGRSFVIGASLKW